MNAAEATQTASTAVIERSDFSRIIELLKTSRYNVIGPRLVNGAILYDELTDIAELPVGWTDAQQRGAYRLKQRADEALFGYRVGPQSWKKFFHPATAILWQARRTSHGFNVSVEPEQPQKLALLGVRACDLHAISILDNVLGQGTFRDPIWTTRRKNTFVIAVNCTEPGNTCFCASMKTGPRATSGFDLALTEIIERNRHYFLASPGTDRGKIFLGKIPHRAARADEIDRGELLLANAANNMGRNLDTTGLKELLYRNHEHPRWDNVAARCLSCANCTMVCPTCFCTTVEDTTDILGQQAARVRKWDSCFTLAFSFIHSGSVRGSVRARYRQWLMHKLATWHDQFGTFGCVGCGRCITWCPAGIDITEEVEAIRQTDGTRLRKEVK